MEFWKKRTSFRSWERFIIFHVSNSKSLAHSSYLWSLQIYLLSHLAT